MIKLELIGNLGKDCVVNTVNGRNVINFNVAHSERYKDAQGVQKDRVIWVDCAYWTERTAIAPYLKKGQSVYVEGQPDVRSYTTNDGRTGATLALRVQRVELLGNRQNNEGGGQPMNSPSTSTSNDFSSPPPISNDVNTAGDDLPF